MRANKNIYIINVLLDYVLKNKDGKLYSNYVETIAGHWKRLNIQTAEEAINVIKNEYRKYGKRKV